MFGFSDDLKIISSFRKRNKSYRKIEKRDSHAFIFKIKAPADYAFDGKRLHLSEDEFIFCPKGITYEYTTDEDNLYTSINFQGTVGETTIRSYPQKIFYGSDYICQSFTELWNFGSVADRYQCYSIFYDLLSHIDAYERLNDDDRRKQSRIDPAMEYLKIHLYDSSLRIEHLPSLCGMSDTYFRKIFAERFHMSPQEYVTTQRISHAKAIIEMGDFDSIREVAESVGYSDPLYFSKSFKKIYGIAPSNIGKEE